MVQVTIGILVAAGIVFAFGMWAAVSKPNKGENSMKTTSGNEVYTETINQSESKPTCAPTAHRFHQIVESGYLPSPRSPRLYCEFCGKIVEIGDKQ